jgi:methionyl-tRNA formyltransferase
MRIVFIGAVDFSRYTLEATLINQGHVVGIVTPADTGANADFCDLSPVAHEWRIPIHYCKNVNAPETIDWIKGKSPDIIFCWGFSQLIRQELLNVPPLGIIGYHPALLPANRGRHPLIWALCLGLKESGSTFFRMEEGADSGPILSQEKFPISPEDDAFALQQRIKEIASVQISNFLPRLVSGRAEFKEQDPTLASYWRKRTRADGIIDWRMNSEAILNLIRALTHPYPGAEFKYKGQFVTAWKASPFTSYLPKDIEPTKVVDVIEGKPVIKCYDRGIIITHFEPEIDFVPGGYLE